MIKNTLYWQWHYEEGNKSNLQQQQTGKMFWTDPIIFLSYLFFFCFVYLAVPSSMTELAVKFGVSLLASHSGCTSELNRVTTDLQVMVESWSVVMVPGAKAAETRQKENPDQWRHTCLLTRGYIFFFTKTDVLDGIAGTRQRLSFCFSFCSVYTQLLLWFVNIQVQ